jgi:hypothetical protein
MLLTFFNKTSSYLWNKLPENVKSYLLNTALTISGQIWNKLPESVKSYAFHKAVSIGSNSATSVELSSDEKTEIANLLDSLNLNEVLPTPTHLTPLTPSETTLSSEINKQSSCGFFDTKVSEQDTNEDLHVVKSVVMK